MYIPTSTTWNSTQSTPISEQEGHEGLNWGWTLGAELQEAESGSGSEAPRLGWRKNGCTSEAYLVQYLIDLRVNMENVASVQQATFQEAAVRAWGARRTCLGVKTRHNEKAKMNGGGDCECFTEGSDCGDWDAALPYEGPSDSNEILIDRKGRYRMEEGRGEGILPTTAKVDYDKQ
ncbi:uncharacterized protein LACBIDRAFT_331100 [Laccaria bicolor S238N-H82]|uniref:Predicted protein n=1 Tax=Laccaria bicolor (strain S238N-H82 / ATCC MYA-4686) TaxID=486041 RepID=B0DNH1_LACBS|nr:uncharacterized protein LACBIDRAFT_331100 [Laccaria bicolor S238N-H82]EDR03868.1 predicted protein [Laccaria bicolor S238N-H82]|eukprot:XP_001885436.1 predicted protein [Laccaria bicolor S238N-H82]